MSEWTPEALAAYKAREDAWIAEGVCPWSGETLVHCQITDLCDCFLPRVEGPLPDFRDEERFTWTPPT